MSPWRKDVRWSRPRTWSLGRRIAVAMAVTGVFLVGVITSSALTAESVREQQQRVVEDYFVAIEQSRRNFLALVDIESAVRGYALSRDPALLDELARSGRPWDPAALGRARRLLAGETEPLAHLDAAQREARSWYQEWAVPEMERTRRREPVGRADIEAGEVRFDRVRAAYDVYFDSLHEIRNNELEALGRRVDLLVLGVVLSALISAFTLTALWWLLRIWVSVPVNRLAAEARRVRVGELDLAVGIEGPPEIVQLGRDVEAMRGRLVHQIEELIAAGRATAEAQEELQRKATDLQRSNRDLEQFAYVASHDLQEPLRKVASFCQLLQQRYAGRLDDRADQYIAFAVDGAKRMQRLINDLLAFSRVGRLTTPPTWVDLGDCLRQSLRDLSEPLRRTGAEVTATGLPVVLGEAPLLSQLLTNLVGNAIKFHGAEPPRVHLAARRAGDVWELSCADNGIGIEPQYAERVFLIFQRLHTRDVYEGTGIGLALCKKIVEYHGGRIWIDNEVVSGTTVRWTLPAGGTPPKGGTLAPDTATVGDPGAPVDPGSAG